MPTVATRRRLIRRLINERSPSNQHELVELLASAGHEVTQATVSRDLEALGAVKVPGGGYAIARAAPAPGQGGSAADAIASFVDEISASANLVVLKTSPGAAQVVAAALDAVTIEGVVGTVAGDDTVLVVATEKLGGQRLAQRLETLGAL